MSRRRLLFQDPMAVNRHKLCGGDTAPPHWLLRSAIEAARSSGQALTSLRYGGVCGSCQRRANSSVTSRIADDTQPAAIGAVRMVQGDTEMLHCTLVIAVRSENTCQVASQERVAGVEIDLCLELLGSCFSGGH